MGEEKKHRVLFISSQPMQNPVPLQLLARHPNLEMQMAYCSLPHETQLWQDSEQLNKTVFDTPMLEGYPWTYISNYSPNPSLGKFWGLFNPGIVKLIPKFDCCVIYGHSYITFWLAILTAKLTQKPLLLSTDATYLESREGGNWKQNLKKKLFPFLYNKVADGVLVPSTASQHFLQSLGISPERIFITPYCVDNDSIATIAEKTDCEKVRSEWKIPQNASVIVFCAKFIERKSPQDLLKAFAKANVPNSYLVLVGDGPLKDELHSEAETLGITDKIRFLGFVKYSELPEVYTASDLLVHPAEWEPYGLIVNEAMVCGIPVIVSDRVGAGYDLVVEEVTGFIYPWGNVEALAKLLKQTLNNPIKLREMGLAAQHRMKTWSSFENASSTIKAIEHIITNKSAAD